MDTNKIREQFEVWAAGHFLDAFDRNILQTDRWGDYVLGNVRMAWTAWHASREAAVVELPSKRKIRHLPTPDENSSYNEALENCRDAIEAQSLKVKP